ncbi:hypothetical protein [Caulobacter sp. NIBR1757]|uniref:hypothetical protein n=1 Tax=Caulobacter sp. NIBR1757 TaxID=3016000 RepID=UPI0022F101BF|nr:hypothetical protein [Caulobacter sp. NIBR1757]WGM39349.1 hypothetical protein AMEJIAPC_02267 [Caulobacter sp. NIBR1757]
MRAAPIAILALAAMLAGCATQAPVRGAVESSVEQPFRDLNILRETPAEVLAKARLAPYAPPLDPACPAIAEELVLLEAALGPDIDGVRAAEKDDLAAKLTSDAVGDLIGLPYRGLIRRMTGADRQEREARARKLAGSIRRGFLKGWARSIDCPPASGPN